MATAWRMRAPLLRHSVALSCSRRWLSSSASASNARRRSAINLTPIVSPLLLRLHPDRMQRHSPALAADNEDALKQLNAFLEIASCGCNNDGYRARKLVLSLAASHHDDPDAPIRMPLKFHIESSSTATEHAPVTLTPVEHVLEVPSTLVRRTLLQGARTASGNLSDAVATPFAREWQRTTKRALQQLFAVAEIPLHREDASPTLLAQWIEEDENDDGLRHERSVGAHNAAMRRMQESFNELYEKMLAREKNIVHPVTTGLEDGPTTQHAVLTRLVAQRLFLERISDREEKRRVFFWLANLLLTNFMELRLHALVWNKVVLLVTKAPSESTSDGVEVLWTPHRPEEGMAIAIPADMETGALVDALFEHTQELEAALHHRARRSVKQAPRTTETQTKKRKKHFYADEMAAVFRRR
ncbi:hypothetical protein PINS_up012377 [Pythium insidiosum]|nr:hypothetical protein PINS_up012377 [Pythium insidiosum]